MPRYDLMHWSQRVRDQKAIQRFPVPLTRFVAPPDPAAGHPPRTRAKQAKPTPDPEADYALRLCSEGRLFELQALVESGRSIAMPPGYKRTPLRVAVRTGFHSLIEFLLEQETGQAAKDDAFVRACYTGHTGAVELALRYGADPKAISFFDALRLLDRRSVAILIEHGADPISDHPFARAFDQRLKNVTGCFLDCRQARPDLQDALQRQADMALRQACSDEDARWVNHLLKIGANPRARGTTASDLAHPEFREIRESAIEIACRREKVGILKRFKPDPAVDDLAELVQSASYHVRPAILRHLLELGGKLNDQKNGGSSALDFCLRNIRWQAELHFDRRSVVPASELRSYLATLRMLISHGALWKPDARGIADARRALYGVQRSTILEIIDLLRSSGACDAGVLYELMRTAKMQELVRQARRALAPQAPKRRTRIGRDDLAYLLGLPSQPESAGRQAGE